MYRKDAFLTLIEMFTVIADFIMFWDIVPNWCTYLLYIGLG